MDEDPGLLVLAQSGSEYIIGVDEVGMGAWAGPLVVAAVVVKRGWAHPDVRDSKAYSSSKSTTAHEKRKRASFIVHDQAKLVQMRAIDSKEVDELGINKAQIEGMRAVIQSCIVHFPESVVVVDGTTAPSVGEKWLQGAKLIAVAKADKKVPAVSAASVVAKVWRDTMMKKAAVKYPGYDFENNVGYGTPKHQMGLSNRGLCELHRQSYRPVRQYMFVPSRKPLRVRFSELVESSGGSD